MNLSVGKRGRRSDNHHETAYSIENVLITTANSCYYADGRALMGLLRLGSAVDELDDVNQIEIPKRREENKRGRCIREIPFICF